ncbi:MAG: GTP-binding protein [Candidatus Lokiarchaeota archaeon]|nr:GTP-binding protein [Candidatus Lokiarchaeota archaeon]
MNCHLNKYIESVIDMLNSITIIRKNSGVWLFTKNYEIEFDSTLFSGFLTAVQNFVESLKIGKLTNFITNDKQIILASTKRIVVSLIIDLNDDADTWMESAFIIAEEFENKYNLDRWSGDISKFKDFSDNLKDILDRNDEKLPSKNKKRNYKYSVKDLSNNIILNNLLRNFIKKVPLLLGILILDLKGNIIAQQTVINRDKKILTPVMCEVERIKKILKSFPKNPFRKVEFNVKDLQIFYLELSGENPALFILITDSSTYIERIIPYSYIIADKVSLILNNEKISTELPEFNYEHPSDIIKLRDNKQSNEIKNLKILIIGPKRVGKSTFKDIYFIGGKNNGYHPTIGVSYILQKIKISQDKKLNLHLFDISGLKNFKKSRKYYFKNPDAIICLFDYSRIETLDEVHNWIEEAKYYCKVPDISYFLIGNKLDLVQDRELLKDKAQSVANKYDCLFYEVSSLTGEGIDEVFTQLVSYLLHY